MMNEYDYMLLILGMCMVTFLPRWLPVFFLSNRQLPTWFEKWLELIPVALLSAILLPSLIITKNPMGINVFSKELLVAVPTFIIAFYSRSLAGTILGGMFLYWLTVSW
ncbi:MAG: AzlD domain-containing protein [Proteobacteria bacterium]|nr:AzlD domain-containing protein [Pseudomonadota bacterium]